MINRTRIFGTVSSLALVAGLGAIAKAQDTTVQGQTATTLPEVIVTGSRIRENVQTVPAAIAVLSGQQLAEKNVKQLADLQYAAPSLSITDAALTQNVNIRGIGLSSGSPSVQPGVPVYLDALVQPPIVTTSSFYDIKNVEVYRGPQGTFAGANSTGGAVFVTSNSPDLSGFGGNIEAWLGDYWDAGVRGAVNMPLSDTVGVRVAFNAERRNSFYDNASPALTPTGVKFNTPGKLNEQDARVSFLWQPTEDLSVLLKLAAGEKSTDGYPAKPIPGTAYAGSAPMDPWTLSYDQPEKNDERATRNMLEVKYVLPTGITLRSVTGYQDNSVKNVYDTDGSTGAPAQYEAQDVGERPVTQEVNIISPDEGPFKWIIGGFYWDDKIKVGLDLNTAGNPHTYITIDTHKKAAAGFGRVQYDITDDVQFELGGRYTHDNVGNDVLIEIAFPGGPPLATIPQSDTYSGNNWTGKAAINFKLDDHNFLYAFVAKGAKAGGTSGAAQFKSETVWSYETGWKSSFMDNRVTLQLDGFYNQYNNFQVDAVDTTTGNFGTVNTAGAKIHGIELQSYGSFGAFRYDFAGAWVHSSIGAVTLVNTRALPGGGAINLGVQCGTPGAPLPPLCFDYSPYYVSVSGRSNPYAPKWTLSAGAQYSFDLPGESTLTPRVDYSYQGSQWSTMLQGFPQDYLASRSIWNARLTYSRQAYNVVAYVTNIFDKTYVSGQFINTRFLGAPREYGVRLMYNF
jgi:iron complex outermembrane recepter protein